MPPLVVEQPGRQTAIMAATLYLVNLMLLPGAAFLGLIVLYLRLKPETPPLAVAHVQQALFGSLWAGGLLVGGNLVILALGGWDGVYTWVTVILYFTCCHATMILLGVIALVKAMAGVCWRYPLIGRALPEGCHT